MAKSYVQVRVLESTMELLRAEKAAMERANEIGHDYEVSEDHGIITVDTVIRELLLFRASHRYRAHRSNKKSAAKRAKIGILPVPD